MIYLLKNRFLGWDYIYWQNTADQGVARVFFTQDGRVAYWRYATTELLDIISTKEQVIWLTCKPSKFGL